MFLFSSWLYFALYRHLEAPHHRFTLVSWGKMQIKTAKMVKSCTVRLDCTLYFDCNSTTLFLTGIHSNPAPSSISTSLDDIVRDSLQLESDYYGVGNAGRTPQSAATVASSLPEQRPTTSGTSNPQDASKSLADRPRLGEFSYNEEDLSQVDKDLIFEGLKQLYYKKVQNESFTIHLTFVVSLILHALCFLMW